MITSVIRRQGQFFRGLGDGTPAGGGYLAEKFAIANVAAGTTDGAVVAAVSGKKIRVLSYSLSALAAGATTATFTSKPGGAGSAVSPVISLGANGFAAESSDSGLFETVAGQGLSLTTAAGAGVGVRVTYIEVD